MRLDRVLADFDGHLTQAYRAASAAAYRADLKLWRDFLAERGIVDIEAVQPEHLRHFLRRERARGVAIRSLRRRFAALRALYRYLQRRHPSLIDPSQHLRLPKLEQHFPDWLTVDQAQQLLNVPLPPSGQAATTPERQAGLAQARDRAMLELLYSSALRVSELVAIDLDHLDLAGAWLRVSGKGGKERMVPVGQAARAALRAYLPLRATLAATGTAALFLNQRGGRLTVRSVQRIVDRWGRDRLGQALHPHALRHSAASHLLQSSGDLRAVQDFLGHAGIATTAIYTHLDHQHLAAVYDSAHPRAHRTSPKQSPKEDC
ncbi:MAG: tyrosine-type recombinase/integrase [Acidithiobacillus sp.]